MGEEKRWQHIKIIAPFLKDILPEDCEFEAAFFADGSLTVRLKSATFAPVPEAAKIPILVEIDASGSVEKIYSRS